MIELPLTYTSLQLDMSKVYELNKLGDAKNRMQHLQEEQGELAGAILNEPLDNIASEAVDVLLMLLSIFADYYSDAQELVSQLDQFHQDEQRRALVDCYGKQPTPIITHYYLMVCEAVGEIANLLQIINGVHSSQYKDSGEAHEELHQFLLHAIQCTLSILCRVRRDVAFVQQTYNDKMAKWEAVSK